jgi:hypothetical protein
MSYEFQSLRVLGPLRRSCALATRQSQDHMDTQFKSHIPSGAEKQQLHTTPHVRPRVPCVFLASSLRLISYAFCPHTTVISGHLTDICAPVVSPVSTAPRQDCQLHLDRPYNDR